MPYHNPFENEPIMLNVVHCFDNCELPNQGRTEMNLLREPKCKARVERKLSQSFNYLVRSFSFRSLMYFDNDKGKYINIHMII